MTSILQYLKGNVFIIIGVLIMLHWVALVIDRITHNISYNLFWFSHLALVLAAAGFILRSNLLLTTSLISILLGHGLWVFDLLVLVITGNSPLNYSSYFFDLSFYRKILTAHHIYLIPLLLITLWKQKKISKYGWLLASILFAAASFLTVFFVPKEYNVNCAHFVCPALIEIFPFLGFLATLDAFNYLIAIIVIMSLFGFLLPNVLIYWLFKLRKQPAVQGNESK